MKQNMEGKKFHKLIVIKRAEKKGKYRQSYWRCKCDCGNFTDVSKQCLESGQVKSCGCLKKSKETRYGEISGNYWYGVRSNAKKRKIEFDLTIQEVWDLFLKQKAKCSLTGETLTFNPEQTASLDRIDNKKGYISGNVWWVHKQINHLKSDFDLKELSFWCSKINAWGVINKERRDKWDKRFIELAKHVSLWSKDPSTKVGAVLFDKNNRIISLGYNGFAQGVDDTEDRLNIREVKYKMVVHAEINAILFANQSLKGANLATWPFMPCASCAASIIQAGITRCVAPFSDNERWVAEFELSKQMFKEAGVQVELLEPALFG